MRKTLLLSYLWLVCAFTSAGQASDLFISEYIEGSSYNKAIELYNGTGSSISLNPENENGYFLLLLINPEEGENWSDASVISFQENFSLLPDSTYIICHTSAIEELLDMSHQASGQLRFNGNDPLALVKDVNSNQEYDSGEDIILDVVGDFSGTNFAQNITLVRLPGYDGEPHYYPSEWEGFEEDDFSHLGTHTWETQADTLPPQITFYPEDKSQQVDTLIAPTITFDEPIYHTSGANIDNYGSLVELTSTATAHACQFNWEESSNMLTIQPEVPLLANTQYQLTLKAVEDVAGNETRDTSITFTTIEKTTAETTALLSTTQPESSSISSLKISHTEPTPVFSFVVKDMGTADTLPTRLNQIAFHRAASDQSFLSDSCIAGYQLQTDAGASFQLPPPSTITTEQVVFDLSENPIEIMNETEKRYTLYIWLQEDVQDQTLVQFQIPQEAQGFEVAANSSPIQKELTEPISGNAHTIEVVATEIHFFNQPTEISAGEPTKEILQIWATDAHNNIDTDYQKEIELSTIPESLLQERVRKTALNGIAYFDSLIFIEPCEECYLIASDKKYTAQSNPFVVTDSPRPFVLFTEYIEGSSYNKALEIGNLSDTPMDLSDYEIRMAPNGGDWKYTLQPQHKLNAGDVFVIAHNRAEEALLAVADTLHSVANFNGDDAIGLFYKGTLMDVLGIYGEDPGNGWEVAGISNATKDHTLIRKAEVIKGTTYWSESAGTDSVDAQWIVKPQDYSQNLGSLTAEKSHEARIIEFTIAGQIGETRIDTLNHHVVVTMPDTIAFDNLSPIIEVSKGATIDPPSGVACNFTHPVIFTVTAEDGNTQVQWTATIEVVHIVLPDIYFSEYSEGDLYNRAIELYNPTPETLSMEFYRILLLSNEWPGDTVIHAFKPSRTLAPKETITLVHQFFKQYQLPRGNYYERLPAGSILDFDGNDRLVLQKFSSQEEQWEDLDLIGDTLLTSSHGWQVGDTPNATLNHTLMRKFGTLHPSQNWESSAGTSLENSQWIVQRKNHTANLGLPTPEQLSDAEIVEVSTPETPTNCYINYMSQYVILTIHDQADISALPIYLKLSPGADSQPSSGSVLDLSNGPITVKVVAENGDSKRWWLAARLNLQSKENTPMTHQEQSEDQKKAAATSQNLQSLSIYPNPVHDHLHFAHIPLKNEHPIVRIYSSDGVLRKQIRLTESTYSLDMSSLPTGIYVIKINNAKQILTKRIIKE
ncbi:MAG: lamin tail domain-containing protein [Bacteroidota bacterium]